MRFAKTIFLSLFLVPAAAMLSGSSWLFVKASSGPPPDPSTITGCRGFYYADAGVGASTITDQCASANTLTKIDGPMPSTVASQINGKSILRFTGTIFHTASNFLATPAGGFTIYLVLKMNSYDSGYNIFLSSNFTGGSGAFLSYSISDGGWGFFHSGTYPSFKATVAQDTSAFHSVLETYDGSGSAAGGTIYYDGVPITVSAGSTPSVSNAAFGAAEFPTNTVYAPQQMNMDWAATAVYDHALSGPERTALFAWQSSYYNF